MIKINSKRKLFFFVFNEATVVVALDHERGSQSISVVTHSPTARDGTSLVMKKRIGLDFRLVVDYVSGIVAS